MRILVLGANGMLGNTVVRFLSIDKKNRVYATLRKSSKILEEKTSNVHFLKNISLESEDGLLRTFALSRPDVVINCVGLVKQLKSSQLPIESILINSLLPHRIARLCEFSNARFIHISTDCVFSGKLGNYSEDDIPDANDLYGRSKLMGEVCYGRSITLRTSIIGHEIERSIGLLEWFLKQEYSIKGYQKAIFSGLPTVELARVISDYIIPNENLTGLYHVAAKPISKFHLLEIINEIYKKRINIQPDDELTIDRSLDASYFNKMTGYKAPDWYSLISKMKDFL